MSVNDCTYIFVLNTYILLTNKIDVIYCRFYNNIKTITDTVININYNSELTSKLLIHCCLYGT